MTTPPTGARQPVSNPQENQDPTRTAKLRIPRPPRTPSPHPWDRAAPRYDYEHYSRLAGPLTRPEPGTPYRVAYRGLLADEPHRLRAGFLLCLAPLLSAGLLVWLMQPAHWTERDAGEVSDLVLKLDVVMLVSIGLIELFRTLNVISNAHATLVARDPIPVVPEAGTRVAFLTSFVPGKEPIGMVTKTLEAAVRVRHRGTVHVWLLDEGDDPEVKEVCRRLGVHHFSRKGVAQWNTQKGAFRAKTKHGNYNAWLDAHGDSYDYFAGVDTDHVPLANYLERMLGYFRDPDVGFVIGPQVYGNYDNFVTKAAESQQFLFHALIQRAGNAYDAPMFVGTSNAVRISALKSIGGLYDSITEDMATGFEMHRHRNPATGNKWRSVYTPDVLAVGEGPNAWTDFFTQQLRWSRGTYETILGQYWRGFGSMPLGKLFNYTMLMIFYPISALNWILAALSCALFLGMGASGVQIDPTVWMALYGNATALQIGLYIWNRRHNVSPHEPEGSGGLAGMLMSALSAPIYARSLFDTVLRRKSKFVVTPKGNSASPDTLFGTFRIHLFFIAVFGGSLVGSLFLGHDHPAMLTWAGLALLITAAPIIGWRVTVRAEKRRRARRRARSRPAGGRQDDATGYADAPGAGVLREAAPAPAAAVPTGAPHGSLAGHGGDEGLPGTGRRGLPQPAAPATEAAPAGPGQWAPGTGRRRRQPSAPEATEPRGVAPAPAPQSGAWSPAPGHPGPDRTAPVGRPAAEAATTPSHGHLPDRDTRRAAAHGDPGPRGRLTGSNGHPTDTDAHRADAHGGHGPGGHRAAARAYPGTGEGWADGASPSDGAGARSGPAPAAPSPVSPPPPWGAPPHGGPHR